MKALTIPDCVTFRKMWRDGASVEDIAARFGLNATCAVGRARVRYKYPARARWTNALQGPMPTTPPERDPWDTSTAPISGATALRGDFGRWSTDQVVAVLQTQGRYAKLTDLADRWGVQVTAVVALWHRVRVAA